MADNPKTFDTGLTKEQLTTAFSRALNDYTNAQIDAKFSLVNTVISSIQNSLKVYLIESNDEDNPTYDTPTACKGIMLELATGEDTDVGFRLFAGTSGEIYMSARHGENAWHDWSEVVKLPDSEA